MTSTISAHPVCQALAELGVCYPGMRFGQLIATSASPGDVEEFEDSALVAAARRRAAHRREVIDGAALQPQTCRTLLLQAFEALAGQYPQLQFGQLAVRVAERAFTNLYDIEDDAFLAAARLQLDSGTPLATSSRAVTFPHVIRTKLKYIDELEPSDFVRVIVPDGCEMLRWYFEKMTGGRRYDEKVQRSWNRASPNELVRQVMNIPYIWDDQSARDRGLKRLSEKTALYGDTCPPLQILGLWFQLEPNLGAFGLGIRQFRYHAGVSNNMRALENIAKCVRQDGAENHRIPAISRLRILDILAWAAYWHMDPKNHQEGSSMISISEGSSE